MEPIQLNKTTTAHVHPSKEKILIHWPGTTIQLDIRKQLAITQDSEDPKDIILVYEDEYGDTDEAIHMPNVSRETALKLHLLIFDLNNPVKGE